MILLVNWREGAERYCLVLDWLQERFVQLVFCSWSRSSSCITYLQRWSQRCLVLCSVLLQYITVQYSTVLYCTVQYSTVQSSAVQCSTVQCSTVQYSAVQYSTVQRSTVQYSTVQYSTVQCSTVHWRDNEFWPLRLIVCKRMLFLRFVGTWKLSQALVTPFCCAANARTVTRATLDPTYSTGST